MEMQKSIAEKIKADLHPIHLEVVDESRMHHVQEGAQSHFKVVVAAEAFSAVPLLQRHRRIHRILQEEMQGSVHALALHAFSPEEWRRKHGKSSDSPACLG